MAALSRALSDAILKQVSDWLEARADIQVALVYGSFALGHAEDRSDLDLALAGDKPLSPEQRVEWSQDLGKLIGREVDLIDLRVATGTVLAEALTKGRILKKNDPSLLARILKRMWIDREDFENQRERTLTARRKKAFGG